MDDPVNRVAKAKGFHPMTGETVKKKKKHATYIYPPRRGDGDDDDLEDLAWQNSIPNTFGKESDKLGRPISNSFGPGFLQKVAAAGKDGERLFFLLLRLVASVNVLSEPRVPVFVWRNRLASVCCLDNRF